MEANKAEEQKFKLNQKIKIKEECFVAGYEGDIHQSWKDRECIIVKASYSSKGDTYIIQREDGKREMVFGYEIEGVE